MEIKFKEYTETDFGDLVRCMEKLQDYVTSIDPLRRLRRLPEYGEKDTKKLLEEVGEDEGIILLAYDQEKIVGFIAGIIEKQSEHALLMSIPTKAGRILELFVEESCRDRGVGKGLMSRTEQYFKQNGCNVCRVGVFEPNKSAHSFYLGLDYHDRSIDMIKELD